MFVGASTQIIGRSHEAEGLPCQDRATVWNSADGDRGILVLCDGAGSCLASEIGAEAICSWFPQWVESQVAWWSSPAADLGPLVIAAIRERLEAEAAERSLPIKALSSTFLAVTAQREANDVAYRILHLGDGIAACIEGDGAVILSEPDNAEFANETVFTTSRSARTSLRVTEGRAKPGCGFVLMSDGSGASLFLKTKRALAPAVAEMLAWLNDHDSDTVSQALEANGKELFTRKTGDDCSIALLLDRDPQNRFEIILEHPQPDKLMSNHSIKAPKKLIEVALPLDAINTAAAREKSIRHGHPSTLHLWWARRPLAAARAVIFSQLVNDPSWKWEMEHPGEIPPGHLKASWAASRKRLFKIIEDLVLWENTTNEAVLERAREEIRKSWRETCELNKNHPQARELFDPEKLPALHDPFAGGGAIPLEAQRLGLEAWASDLNPVAVLINKAMIEIPPKFAGRPPVNPAARRKVGGTSGTWKGATGLAEDVRYYGQWMREEAQKRIGHLYPPVEVTEEMARTRPDLKPYVGQKLTVIAWIWARTVKSPNPAFSHVDVPLASTFILSSKAGKEAYVKPVIEGDSYRFEVKVGRPPEGAKEGTKAPGRGAAFHCLLSKTPIGGDYIKDEGKQKRLGARLMAVVAEGVRGRVYLDPSSYMETVARSAEASWRPLGDVPARLTGGTCVPYGLSEWGDLFTPRQLVALTTFSDLVGEARERILQDAIAAGLPIGDEGLEAGGSGAKAYAEAVAVYLAFAISRSADRGSSICSWDNSPKMEALRNTFGRQAIPMVWDFAEGSPFSASSGNWMNNIEWGAKVAERLSPANRGMANQADAQTQTISRSKFVSTDPPYYDNIGYADLSDFFYVWLRKSLKDSLPALFTTIAVPKAEELVATPYRHGSKQKAETFFLDGMTSAMQRLADLSHPSAPITIYYAFKQSETSEEAGTLSPGWVTFLGAVHHAGMQLCGTWPMRTELGNRMIGAGNNALASSIILVCRKRPAEAPTISRREFQRELNRVLPEALDEMTKGSGEDRSPVAPVDLSQAIIGPGMAVFSKYSAVLEADGTPMSVRTALQLINRFLAEDDFDADTQFCLHWFEQYGWQAGPFGEGDTLARAKGTSVDGVKQAGVIESGGGKVRLLKWAELRGDWDPRKDARVPVWQALHQLILCLRREGERPAGELLALVAGKAESIRQLAYRLYTLCERKNWAEEARAYNELITSWAAVERAAANAPKQRELFE
jgi:putative DNA methylase